MTAVPYRRPSTPAAKWDPAVCTHDNASPVYWMADCGGSPAIVDEYVECPDCDSKFTIEEFDALCYEAYMRASAEARYFDYGYWELYGHLPKVHTQSPPSEHSE